MRKITPDDALEVPSPGRQARKVAIVPTKPLATQEDLGLATRPVWRTPYSRSSGMQTWHTNTPPGATWWRLCRTALPSWGWATGAR